MSIDYPLLATKDFKSLSDTDFDKLTLLVEYNRINKLTPLGTIESNNKDLSTFIF